MNGKPVDPKYKKELDTRQEAFRGHVEKTIASYL